MFSVTLLVLLGLCGFALDISRVYNRKAELQSPRRESEDEDEDEGRKRAKE